MRATKKEPMVSVVRIFFRMRLARRRGRNFMRGPPGAGPPLPSAAASTSTPLSRWRRALARSAARGSWVTIRMVVFRSETSRPRRSRISSALRRSRSPVGSSHSRKVGSATIARAIATRCSCPPESCRGKWCMRSASPTSRNAASTCSRRSATGERGQEQGQLHVAEGGEDGDQVVGLEHEPDVPGAPGGQLAARHGGDLVARHRSPCPRTERPGPPGGSGASSCPSRSDP